MMSDDKRKEAVAPASLNHPKREQGNGTPAVYPLPATYRKRNRFFVDGATLAFTGGRALLLDALIAAKPAGIDRASTLQWIANISDSVGALKEKGVRIATDRGQPCCYRLLSEARRLEGAI